MNVLLYLLPIALGLGAAGVAAFLWSLRSGQYDDLSGAAERVLHDDPDTLSGRLNRPPAAEVNSSRINSDLDGLERVRKAAGKWPYEFNRRARD